MSHEEEESVDIRARKWDQVFDKWVSKGMPENDPDHPTPGDHPKKDHEWNV